MAVNFEMELKIPGLAQALLTGVILVIIGALTGISFGWLQIIVVMVVVIVASFLVQRFGEAIFAKIKSTDSK